MRQIIIVLTMLTVAFAASAGDVVIDGIKYEISKDKAKCKAHNKKDLVDIEIPASVRFEGLDYDVAEIAREGFSGCPNLKSVVLPNSLKRIGARAFANCPKLETVVVPDDAFAQLPDGNFGFGIEGQFKNCPSLTEVRGHDILYPRYVLFTAMTGCTEAPFYQTILDKGANNMAAMTPTEPNPYATAENRRQNISISYVYNGMTKDEAADAPLPQFAPDTIDLAVPVNELSNRHTFAVIIGNENYKRLQRVDYAVNDAQVFSRYCHLTLGIPQENIREYYDASLGDLYSAVSDIKDIAKAYGSSTRILFYYAGHGLPDEETRGSYLLPVDASGTTVEGCYSLTKLYEELSALDVESVVAFVDACFSGSVRGDRMLASARGVKLRPKEIMPTGKLVVVSATSGDQSAYPYPEKNHGLFSYYLLRKLYETGGDISLGSLTDYIGEQVAMQSVIVNRKLQSPTVRFSVSVSDNWRDMKLK